jgi:hypothetical protein
MYRGKLQKLSETQSLDIKDRLSATLLSLPSSARYADWAAIPDALSHPDWLPLAAILSA